MSAKHTIQLRIYYEDTDVGGVVYYANYLKFTERARTEMIYDRLKLSHKELKDQYDCIFVVKECDIKYLKSAHFEDQIEIKSSVLKKSPVRLILLQEVLRKTEILVTSTVELAIVNSKGSVTKLPKELLSKI